MNGISIATQLLLSLVAQAGTISNLISQALVEKRDLTADELASLASADDTARQQLVADLATAAGL